MTYEEEEFCDTCANKEGGTCLWFLAPPDGECYWWVERHG